MGGRSGFRLDESATPASGPFDVPAEERYRDAGRLGQGGMGEVRAVQDTRLDREVALKVATDARGEAAMIAEARLTARLDHPGIVRVYGAGRLPNGRAYYTMPVLPGRSLAEALAERADLDARLRLVRHLMDACHAVAHAHASGVLHRDLKPANILLGRHGETQVADWGVATELQPDGQSAAEPGLGTPGYCSPEQAAGARLGPTSDVFSLGRTLAELLGETGASVAPELAAIAARATRADPQERYPDASALAEDLLAWFEGRRVHAYAYSRRELLRRTLKAWRVPLVSGAVALAAVLVVVAWSGLRVLRERDLAVLAERRALVEQERAEDQLASALVAQALVAAAQDHQASAEILAANALALRESPEARGVLARFGAPRPTLLRAEALPSCERTALSADGRRLACLQEDQVLDLRLGQGVVGRVPEEASAAAFAGDDGPLVLINADGEVVAWRGQEDFQPLKLNILLGGVLFGGAQADHVVLVNRGREAIWNTASGEVIAGAGCPDQLSPQRVRIAASGALFRACAGSSTEAAQVIVESPGGPPRRLGSLDPQDGPPTALAVDEAAQIVAVGTEGGAVVLLDPQGMRRIEVDDEPVLDLALRKSLLAVAWAGGDVSVWDHSDGTSLARLPSDPARLRWLEDQTLRVVGRAVEDWRIPPRSMAHRKALGPGLSALALSPDGALVASTHGDGQLMVHDRHSGARRLALALHESVAKDVSFSPDNRSVLVGLAGDENARTIDVLSGTQTETLPSRHVRRVAWIPDARFVAPYGGDLLRFGAEPRTFETAAQVVDLEARAGEAGVLVLLEDGTVLSVGARGEPATLGREPSALAVAGGEHATYALLPGALVALAEGRSAPKLTLPGARGVELALSPDGRWLVVGQLDGEISVWRAADGVRVATLRGHNQRVSALALGTDGTLVSGSWDGDLRVWDLRGLDSDTRALLGVLQQDWGRGLSDVLAP